MVGFLPCPIFSAQSLHPRVDFQCHNPVTLACSVWVWYFNLAVARLYGARSSPGPPQWSLHSELWGPGGKGKDKKRTRGSMQIPKQSGLALKAERRTGDTWLQCSVTGDLLGAQLWQRGRSAHQPNLLGLIDHQVTTPSSIAVSAAFCEAAHKHCWLYDDKIFIRGFTNRMIKLPCDRDLAAEA